jgi:hypothetical protein
MGSGIAGSRRGTDFERPGHDIIFLDFHPRQIQHLMRKFTTMKGLTCVPHNFVTGFVHTLTPNMRDSSR